MMEISTSAPIQLFATDIDDTNLTYEIVTSPSNGVLTGTPPDLTYTPKKDFHGSDTLTFKANDTKEDSNIATVTITVDSVNDAPVVSVSDMNITEDENVTLQAFASDPDGSIAAYEWRNDEETLGNEANLTISGLKPGIYTYTVGVLDSDGAVASATATVYVNERAKSILSGQILDNFGAAIAEATVELQSGELITADKDGYYRFEGLKPTTRNIATASRYGFLRNSTAVELLEGKETITDIVLSRPDVIKEFNTTEGVIVTTDENATITLPSDGYVDSKGEPYEGTVVLSTSYFSATTDEGRDAFAGDTLAINENNETGNLVSYGFIKLEMTDENGNKIDFAEGEKMTLSIPADPNMDTPPTIPMWYFDEKKGIWVQDGEAVYDPVTNSYITTVNASARPFNLDAYTSPSWVYTCIEDKNGNMLDGYAGMRSLRDNSKSFGETNRVKVVFLISNAGEGNYTLSGASADGRLGTYKIDPLLLRSSGNKTDGCIVVDDTNRTSAISISGHLEDENQSTLNDAEVVLYRQVIDTVRKTTLQEVTKVNSDENGNYTFDLNNSSATAAELALFGEVNVVLKISKDNMKATREIKLTTDRDEYNLGTIQPELNKAPIAIAGFGKEVYIGTVVTFDGSKSGDKDGVIVKYEWYHKGIQLSNEKSFSLEMKEEGLFVATLVVTDDKGLKASSDVYIDVSLGDIVAIAGLDKYGYFGGVTKLDGSKSFSYASEIVKYEWKEAGIVLGESATLDYKSMILGAHLLTLTVTDANGLVASDDINVTIVETPYTIIADAGLDKYIYLNGTATLSGVESRSYSSDIIKYEWREADTALGTGITLDYKGTTPGVHTVTLTVTDANGLVASDDVNITVTDTPYTIIAEAGLNAYLYLNNTVTIDGSISHSYTAPIDSYQWFEYDNLLSESDILVYTGVSSGVHTLTLTVTDTNGLVANDEINVTVVDTPYTIIAEAGLNKYIYLNNTTTVSGLESRSYSSDIIRYEWSEYGMPVGDMALLEYKGMAPGVHTLTLTVTDANGLVDSDEVNVTVLESPYTIIAYAGLDTFIYLGDSATLSGLKSHSYSAAIVSYEWREAGELLGESAILEYKGMVAGVHTIILTVTDENGLVASDDVNVTVTETPYTVIAEAGLNKFIYLGDIAVLDGSESRSYSSEIISYVWKEADTQLGEGVTLEYQGLSAGVHTLTLIVTDANGLVASDEVNVTVTTEEQTVVAEAGLDRHIYLGSTAMLDASKSVSYSSDIVKYEWRENGELLATAKLFEYNGTSVGTHTLILTVTDSNGLSDSDDVNVFVVALDESNATVVANAGVDQSVYLKTSSTLDGSGSYALSSTIKYYEWYVDGKYKGYWSTPTYTYPWSTSGEHNVTLKVTTTDNLVAYDMMTVYVSDKTVVANAGVDQNVYLNGYTTLDASGSYALSGTITSYQWYIDNSIYASSSFQKYDQKWTSTGEHTVKLKVVTSDGLVAYDTMTVYVSDKAVVANAGVDQNVYLNTSSTLDGSGSYALSSTIKYYRWHVDGLAVTVTYNTSPTLTYTWAKTGEHTVGLEVQTADGLVAYDTMKVYVSGEDNFIVNAGPDQNVTIQDSVTLNGSETYNLKYKIVKYEWREDGTVLGTSPIVWLAGLDMGIHTITLTATDISGKSKSDDVVIRVINGTQLMAYAGKDKYAEEGDKVTLDGSGSYDPDGNITGYRWSMDGATLSNDEVFESSDFAIGTHLITLTVTDNDGDEANDTVKVVIAPYSDTEAPIAQITSPTTDASVLVQTDIIGTVYDKHLKSYRLLISPKGKNDFTVIAEGDSNVESGTLATLDTTTLSNGMYDLSLEAVDESGKSGHAFVTVLVEGKAKVGNFSFTVTDFNLKVGGIPVQVNRTYSTLQRRSSLDFGYGWSIDYQNVKVEENRHPGEDWKTTPDTLIGSCFKFDKPHRVNISLPDGTTEKFEFRFAAECRHYFVGSFYDAPVLYALDGSTAKLEAVDASDSVMMNNYGQIIDSLTLKPFNPSTYRLTLRNGMVYEINEKSGIKKIKDIRGDTLTYNTNGIISSRGESLTFTRDTKGRITKITDLGGRVMEYSYDGNDNLDYVLDYNGAKTEYTYIEGHLLSEYYLPDGTRLTQNIYDESGRLIQTIDSEGNVVEFTHDIDGREEIVKDKLGRTSLFVYDDNGNVLARTNPMGETTTYTYDDKGHELTVTDPLGNTVTNEYDTNGNLLTVTDPLGNSETTEYNAHNSPTSIADKNGNVMSIVYNQYTNNPESFTTPGGATNSFTFDKFGNKLSSTNEYGQTTNYQYDEEWKPLLGAISSKGNIERESRPDGTRIVNTYDTRSNLLTATTTYTKPDGSEVVTTVTNTYDAYDRLITTTDERAQTTTYAYDDRGNKVSETDSQNRTTLYEYTPSNKLSKTTYPDGTSESKTYDAIDNVLSETDREGETTTHEYDGADRLVKTIYPDGTTTGTEYDAAGRTVSTTDQNGNKTSYEYDEGGRKTATIDALGNRTAYTYDAQGNMLTVTDALNQTTSYEYNKLNQRIKTTYPDGSILEEPKNISGMPIKKIDENGNETTYGYDTTRTVPLLNSVTLPNGAITSYTYDTQNRKTTQSDAEGRTTSWSYTDNGEIASETLPMGQNKTFAYDLYGKQTQINDYANKAQKFIYDSNDKLVRIEYADGSTITYDYTPGGRLKSQSDAQGTITNSYDSMGRLISRTDTNGETISYTYDSVGNIIEIATPTQTITKTYTKRNELESVTDAQGTTNYSYDALGRQTSVSYPNGVTTLTSYDSRSRVTKIEHKDSNGNILQSFTYTLDNVGNRLKIAENTGTTTSYEYNSVNQLTKETITNDPNQNNTITTYSYDKVGNLLTKTIDGVATTYSYNDNDQLISQGSVTFTYDENGNLISKEDRSYSYDAQNRLIRLATPTNTIEYTYDANNNRIAKTTNEGTTTYLIDTNTPYAQVITESKANGTEVHYTYGNDLIGNGSNYFLTDALGSTRGLTDSEQNLTDIYTYTPYGELKDHNGTSENSFLYTGEQLDSETDDYYLRARYYSPNSARFLTRDTYDGTAGDPVTQNHYLYGNSNPALFVDPSGFTSTNTGELSAISSISMALTGFRNSKLIQIFRSAMNDLPGIAMSGVRGLAKDVARDAAIDNEGQVSIIQLHMIWTIAKLYSKYAEREASETDSDKIPIQVYGTNNLHEHQLHIGASMLGPHKTNRYPTSVLLHRGERQSRYFLNNAMCTAKGKCRDEYPYNTTIEGGAHNYAMGRVSVDYVSRSESGRQGNFIDTFYSSANINQKDAFFVFPFAPISGYFDKKWIWYSYGTTSW